MRNAISKLCVIISRDGFKPKLMSSPQESSSNTVARSTPPRPTAPPSQLNLDASSTLSLHPPPSPLPPPPPIFNRKRSGSAPAPIKIVREGDELSVFSLTVTDAPRQIGGMEQEQFPVTATAPWSAMFSPALPLPASHPEVPKSAAVPTFTRGNDDLINHAGSTARARHSRQMSAGLPQMRDFTWAIASRGPADLNNHQTQGETNTLTTSAPAPTGQRKIPRVPPPPLQESSKNSPESLALSLSTDVHGSESSDYSTNSTSVSTKTSNGSSRGALKLLPYATSSTPISASSPGMLRAGKAPVEISAASLHAIVEGLTPADDNVPPSVLSEQSTSSAQPG